jgi:ribose/xylose/arabinose/galactoside ABC-type transport system permease subunit
MRAVAIPMRRPPVVRSARRSHKVLATVGILASTVVLVLAATTHRFLTWDNVKAIFSSASLVGIMALGVTFITLVGSLVSLAVAPTAVVAAMVFLSTLGLGLVPALAIAVVVGAIITAAQGVLIGAWNVNPVILTIGASFLIDGFAQSAHGGKIIQPAGDGFATLNSTPAGVPLAVYVMVVLALLFQYVLRRTVLGRQILLVGENRQAARAAGIPIARVVTAAFALAGASIAIGGAFLGAFNNGASTYLEGTLTFDAIAAVLVGGTSIAGGRGSVLRTLWGALAIATISDVLLLRGFGTGVQILLKGVLVVAVVIGTQMRLGGSEV